MQPRTSPLKFARSSGASSDRFDAKGEVPVRRHRGDAREAQGQVRGPPQRAREGGDGREARLPDVDAAASGKPLVRTLIHYIWNLGM